MLFSRKPFFFSLFCIYLRVFLTSYFSSAIQISGNYNEFKNILQSFKTKNFEQIVSLGCSCLPKQRVLSFLSSSYILKNLSSCNHLFDWMVVSNYTLFAEAIKNNLSDVFGKDYLTVKPDTWENRGAVLHNEKYRFQFNHAFDGHRQVSHYNYYNMLNQDSFKRYYHLIDEKFAHLIQNSRLAFSGLKRTLYIAYASSNHSGLNARGITQEDFIKFHKALKDSRKDENFLLLVLVSRETSLNNNYDYDLLINQNLCFHLIDFYLPSQWDSDKSVKQWNDIFQLIF